MLKQLCCLIFSVKIVKHLKKKKKKKKKHLFEIGIFRNIIDVFRFLLSLLIWQLNAS